MVTPSVLSRTTTLSRVPTLNAEHVRARGNVVEPLSSRGWMVWRALRPPGPDEYPESDASTISNSQASIESNIREAIDGKLGTKSPFLTSSFSVLHITLSVLGGALSSGFLIAGGFTIFCAGPGGALVAFALTMLALYAVMTSLMELRCVIPDNVPYYLFSAHLGDHKYGLENWHQGDAPFVGGALGVACAAVYSGFSIVGAEAAATMALRTCTPRGRRLVPAFVCGGLAIFFMTSIFITGLVVSYNSSWFQSDDNAGESAASSTFTFIFEQARLRAGADVVNAVLLVTALFDCCAALYVSSALLQDLAMRSLAPRFLRKPLGQREGQEFSVYCLIVGSVVALTLWGLSNIGTKYSLSIIAGAIGVSGYIMWGLVAIMHCKIRWTKKFRNVAKSMDGMYRAWLFPVGPIFCLAYVISALGGVIWVAVWLGFLVDMFLLATSQLIVFIILLIVAATVQYFGYCRC
ncbi:hypothetical protein GGI09_002137 [Coemansia sp. S100]|nr:hypothetical protein GGI09_002137 [Coemansia sp. S100]